MEQRAEVDGSGNVVVQIVGDQNTLNLKGLAHLALTRYLKLREPRSDADRLSPYALWIPLVGRQRELADLRAWLDSDQAISVRLLTGQAGSGKTRLALELCEEVQKEWGCGLRARPRATSVSRRPEPFDLGLAEADAGGDRLRGEPRQAALRLVWRALEVGQREAALAPAQEAVAIERELATKAPDAYRPALASALNWEMPVWDVSPR